MLINNLKNVLEFALELYIRWYQVFYVLHKWERKSDGVIIYDDVFLKICLFAIVSVIGKGKFNTNLSNALHNIDVARIFDWGGGGQTTNHMQWRHQKFSKKELFVGQKYGRTEDLKSWSVVT